MSSFLFSLSVLLEPCHFCDLYRKPAFWFHWFFSIDFLFLIWFLLFCILCLSLCLLFSCSVLSSSLQPHELQHARLPCPSVSQSLFKLISTESVMPSNHLILCHPLLLLSSIFPSIRVFFNESVLHISSSNEYSGPISLRIGWIFSQSRGLSGDFSSTTVQKHQFFSAQLSLQSISHIHIWLLEKP